MTGRAPVRSRPLGADDGAALSTIARGGVTSLLGASVSAVSQLVVVLVVTRWYTPAEAGALFAATAIFLITVAVVQLGTDQGLVRFVAAHRARGEQHKLRHILRIGLLPVLAASVVGGLAMLGLAGPVARLFASGETTGVAQMLRVLALAVPVAAVHDAMLAASRGLGSLRSTVVVERVVRPLLQLVAITTVAASDLGVETLASAWAAPYLLAVAGSAFALRRTLRRVEGEPAPPRHESPAMDGIAAIGEPLEPVETAGAPPRSLTVEFWSFTVGRAVSRILQVLLQRVDVILVAVIVGTSAAAVYTAATRFIAVGMLANQATQQVIQPRLAAMLARGESQLVHLVLRRTTVWLVALVWPGYLAMIALSPALMSVFGAGYDAGTPSLAILAVAMMVTSAAGPLDVALLMAGRGVASLVNMSIALMVDIGGCLLLLPHLGVTGAAVAWASAMVLRNVLSAWQARRLLGLAATSRALAAVSALAIGCCAAVPVTLAVVDAAPRAVAGTLVAGVAAYALLLYRWRSPLGLTTRPTAPVSAPPDRPVVGATFRRP